MGTTAADWTPRANRAEDYERYLIPAYFGAFAEGLTRLVPPWPGERALDVACGTGVVTRLLAERVGPGGHIVGLDLDAGMLTVARRLLDAPNVAWQEASALAMPFADGAFDLVTCQQGLQFLPDRPAGLREMRRVLRPGGRLALAVWRSTEHNPVFKLLEEALARVVGPEAANLPPFSLGDGAELRRLTREAGFSDVAVRIDGRLARFPSPAEMVRRMLLGGPTMLSALATADAEARLRLVDEVTRTMAPYVDDAGLAVPLSTHVLLAR
jgi:SAM-dependent methyltransferase